MPKSLFPFTAAAKLKSSRTQYRKIKLENMRSMRVLVRNEEVSHRSVRSFYIDPGETLIELFRQGTVFYFWEKNALLAEYMVPKIRSTKELHIAISPNGTLSVS